MAHYARVRNGRVEQVIVADRLTTVSVTESKWTRYFAIIPVELRAILYGFGGRNGSYQWGDLFDVLANTHT
jgi:hypothetical protein